MSSNKIHKELEELRKGNSILHDNIIDLYLQVKIRSNDEVIINFIKANSISPNFFKFIDRWIRRKRLDQ